MSIDKVYNEVKNLLDNFKVDNFENFDTIIENTAKLDNINLEDYTIADDEIEYKPQIDLMNIFLVYFKKMFERQEKANMFDHIDYEKDNSTNKCLEMIYEEMLKYNNSKYDDKDVLYLPQDIDIKKFTELYCLYVENEQKYCSRSLLVLLKYTTSLNWVNINWSIVPLTN